MGQRRMSGVAQSRAALFSVNLPPARGVTRRACAVVARKRKECSIERGLLAEPLPTRLTGANDELAETPKGERDQSMPGLHPKLDAAVRRLGVGQGAHGEGWIT